MARLERAYRRNIFTSLVAYQLSGPNCAFHRFTSAQQLVQRTTKTQWPAAMSVRRAISTFRVPVYLGAKVNYEREHCFDEHY